jgi:MFS family permease
MNRDARLIIAAKAAHGLSQGFISVALALYLDKIGFSITAIGLYLGVGLAGSAVFSFGAGVMSERIGRRTLMVTFAALSVTVLASLALTESPTLLMVFAFLGSLATSPGGPTPAQPLEQAGLAGTATPTRRTQLFASYRLVATAGGAIGALAAGLPALIEALFGVDEVVAFRASFGLFAAVRLGTVAAFAMLSREVEVSAGSRHWTNPLTLPSRRRIFTLAGLFSIDNFGGALIVQSLLSYWLNERFGLEVGTLAVLFFVIQVLGTAGLWASTGVAARFGLINTMVFTQLLSAVLLVVAAFSPVAWLAVATLIVRAFFNQMDMAPRDSYMMAVVTPEERVAISSMHITGRNVLGTLAPNASTFLWTTFSAAAPLVASSIVKIGYDLALLAMFRNLHTEEEKARSEAGVASP